MVAEEGAYQSRFQAQAAPHIGFAESVDDILQKEDPIMVSALAPPPSLEMNGDSVAVSIKFSTVQVEITETVEMATFDGVPQSPIQEFPFIRSGSSTSQGGRFHMEDEHILIDDLSKCMAPTALVPAPIALYGVYDGHGGPQAAAYVGKNLPRLFVEDPNFPQSCEVDKNFLIEAGNSLARAYLQADKDLANEPSVGRNTGTTALTALVVGRHLIVANAGDCRAVLCRNGEAVNMSLDHRPVYPSERKRVEELGGIVTDEGYLNGILSVSRALGDWDMKIRPEGKPSPLTPEPDLLQTELTEDDEFLILACDGIWDVMSSWQAVHIARRSLNKHDCPERCAKDLVKNALRLGALDNLTVVVVCFTAPNPKTPSSPQSRKIRWSKFGISSTVFCSLKGFYDSSNRYNKQDK